MSNERHAALLEVRAMLVAMAKRYWKAGGTIRESDAVTEAVVELDRIIARPSPAGEVATGRGCPACGAKPGERCKTVLGADTNPDPHYERVAAVQTGEADPTPEDIEAARKALHDNVTMRRELCVDRPLRYVPSHSLPCNKKAVSIARAAALARARAAAEPPAPPAGVCQGCYGPLCEGCEPEPATTGTQGEGKGEAVKREVKGRTESVTRDNGALLKGGKLLDGNRCVFPASPRPATQEEP